MKLGIACITYQRQNRALATLRHLQRHTSTPATFVVADDGSTDGTAAAVRWQHPEVTVVTGPNRGVCGNRNRALWWLHVVERCDVTILIEDDTYPTQDGWERDWIAAAQTWGHANLDGAWFRGGVVSGSGTVSDPAVSQGVSGQCSAFSREAIDLVGFYDPRFVGYGGGHVEHTQRLIRVGFGGELIEPIPPNYALWQRSTAIKSVPPRPPQVRYWLLRSPLHVDDEGSHHSPEAVCKAEMTLTRTVRDTVHRMPWRTDADMTLFRSEIDAAKRERRVDQPWMPHGFTTPPAGSEIAAIQLVG